jgi:hypothetical protein
MKVVIVSFVSLCLFAACANQPVHKPYADTLSKDPGINSPQ